MPGKPRDDDTLNIHSFLSNIRENQKLEVVKKWKTLLLPRLQRKGSLQWHKHLKVWVALPDKWLCRCFILCRSESTEKWEETELISGEEHECAWEVQPGKQLVLGDDLEREIPVRNTPKSGWSYVAGYPGWLEPSKVLLLWLQELFFV